MPRLSGQETTPAISKLLRIPFFSTTLSDIRPRCPRRYSMRSAVLNYLSAQRNFPIAGMYSFHTGGDTAATVLTAIRTSRRVARSSVSRPEWSIPRPSRSPIPAPEHRRCSGTIREAMESIRRGHWANRPSSRIASPCTVIEIRNADRKHNN